MKKFCLYCNTSTQDYFICPTCLEGRQKNFEQNCMALPPKVKKDIYNGFRLERFFWIGLFWFTCSLTAFLAIISFNMLFSAGRKAITDSYSMMAIVFMGIGVLGMHALGFMLGIWLWGKLKKRGILLSAIMLFDPQCSYSNFKYALRIILFIIYLYFSSWLIYASFGSAAIASIDLFRFFHLVPLIVFFVWFVPFVGFFALGLLWAGPGLWNYLLTDWMKQIFNRVTTKGV